MKESSTDHHIIIEHRAVLERDHGPCNEKRKAWFAIALFAIFIQVQSKRSFIDQNKLLSFQKQFREVRGSFRCNGGISSILFRVFQFEIAIECLHLVK